MLILLPVPYATLIVEIVGSCPKALLKKDNEVRSTETFRFITVRHITVLFRSFTSAAPGQCRSQKTTWPWRSTFLNKNKNIWPESKMPLWVI